MAIEDANSRAIADSVTCRPQVDNHRDSFAEKNTARQFASGLTELPNKDEF